MDNATSYGSARKLLEKFKATKPNSGKTYTARMHSKIYTGRIHENNGAVFALSNYMFGAILPCKQEFDFNDLYMIDDKGNRNDTIAQIIKQATNEFTKTAVPNNALEKLLRICPPANYKKIEANTPLYLLAGKMSSIPHEQFNNALESGKDQPISLNAIFLADVLRFILCANAENTDIYYSRPNNILVLNADNLYTGICPLNPYKT
jgi:hypothetical protein